MNATLPILAVLTIGTTLIAPQSMDDRGEFSSTTIDVGVVVRDIDASAKFYTETIGLTEVGGFQVGGEFCKDAGLTDGKPLTIRVFALGEGDAATKIKLMEVPDADPKPGDNAYVHSQLGLSYITIHVKDMTQALKRLAQTEVKPLSNGPVTIGEGDSAPKLILIRDPDGNLIEIIGPAL